MKKNTLDNKLVSVVRVRGRVNVRSDITETLNRLNLKRVNNCVLLKVTNSYMGMLNKCHNHVAYGEVNEEALAKLLAKYAPDAKAKDVIDGKYDINKLKEMMPFRLHPPRHGYKSTKLSFTQGGSLGYQGEAINSLIKRMV